ncbi:MAG: hypothetical protein FWD53_05330, partial [Phycisphaerales bacterium]|nr:hypothetical protein [Phycisphaerales bacterium]
IDATFPGLAKSKTIVVPADGGGVEDHRPPYANLEIADDNDHLRVVDATGAPIDCRVGDTLYIPVSDQIMYVLASSTAEDLTALLRQGKRNRLPMLEIEAKDGVLKLTNITPEGGGAISGKLRMIDPKSKAVLGERALEQLAAGQSVELEMSAETSGAIIVEVETERGMQRTAVVP